jgi:hypothetical protein
MESLDVLQREHRMLNYISSLPRRMLQLHGSENVTEFVLHDLCREQCFNLTKAAYFIDNPDFNWTKGVAGFSRQEAFGKSDAIWEKPEEFSTHMKNSAFNQKVRSMARCSLKKFDDGHKDLAAELANDLGFANHDYCTWNMKHDNHGFVVYERADVNDTFAHDHMINGVSLLSFCPVF